MVLLVTSKYDLAADLVVLELQKRGVAYIRFNCEDFPLNVSASWSNYQDNFLNINDELIYVKHIQSVWYRRMPEPNLHHVKLMPEIITFIQRESSVFLDGFLKRLEILWVNSISSVALAENKLLQLNLAEKLGFRVPKTLISNDIKMVKIFCSSCKDVICKPITTSRLKINDKDWGIFTESLTAEAIENSNSVQSSPVILQERITRKSEIRVTVVGNEVFACTMKLREPYSTTIDWHLVDDINIDYGKIKIPTHIQTRIFKMLKGFGLCYGCFDFMLTTNNDWVFLELNPSGQWGWIERKIGFPITESIVSLLLRDAKTNV